MIPNPDSVRFEFSPINRQNPFKHLSNLNGRDTGAVSESDYLFEYTDTIHLPIQQYDHYPLGIKVIQRSYAWARAVRVPIFPIEFDFVNIGSKPLRSVFIGFPMSPFIGDPSVQRFLYEKNTSGYWPEVRTAFVQNPIDLAKGATPIAFTILKTPIGISRSTYRFRWYDSYHEVRESPCENDPRCNDSGFYDWLSGVSHAGEPSIRPNQPQTLFALVGMLYSFGPIDTWSVGETLKVALAIIGGSSTKIGPDNIHDNATLMQSLYSRHYEPDIVLPAPKLKIVKANYKVFLSWGSSESSKDPMKVWDDENAIASFYPPDHWRRVDPPPGHTTGGRVFEGYRLYRSEDPGGSPNSFTLLKQWDMIDSVGPKFEFDTGIETTFVDANLQTGKTYWYSVTSFGIPDLHVIDYLDFDGTVKKETLNAKSAESSVIASRKRVSLPFSVSQKVGEVKVVPNPYRGDQNYTFESGGWEGRTNAWNENKRVIKFIHLPTKCTLRIYSLVGEVITTIYHEDPTNGDETWNLLSESNRAIASGVYIFSVESNLGTQVGKFVVIR